MTSTTPPAPAQSTDEASQLRREVTELAQHVLTPELGTGPQAWSAVCAAGLISLALPEQVGGDGTGLQGAAPVLIAAGQIACGLPVFSTLALGALPLAACGSADQQHRFLAPVVTRNAVLTAALNEPSSSMPRSPRTIARAAGDGWVLDGTVLAVPDADRALRILVPVMAPDGPAVALVDPRGAGVHLTGGPVAGAQPRFSVQLRAAALPAGDLIPGAQAVAQVHRHALAGAALYAHGLIEAALALTVRHVADRHQFGRPLATFQAVTQQIADVYMVARALELTASSAAERLHAGRPDDVEEQTAAHWVSHELLPALGICHHLHGGLGVDQTYPLHHLAGAARDLVAVIGGPVAATHRLAASLSTLPEMTA
jgi:3-oxo-4-pregnene-20-carboxyl-CoA dehydrogenase alpha subunit